MFDDIRPYRDSEIPAAIHRMVADPLFPLVASYVFPSTPPEKVAEDVLSMGSIHDFQSRFMYHAVNRIIENSTSGFVCTGLENINPDRPHVFVSNHRDIVLDASLLQNKLLENGFDTTEITFGANLMKGDFIVDFGKCNKMFRVERPGGGAKAFYAASKHLSEYIFHTVLDSGHSIWIAQRNGRTKDGIDRTDPGIVNMLTMGSDLPASEALSSLSLQPISISYEWEPCDVFKAVEMLKRESGPYVKSDGEDLNSIIAGLLQQKGRVHMHVCPEITGAELEDSSHCTRSDFRKRVAALLDIRICSAYRLFPNNYIAHDLLTGSAAYASRYSAEQKESFIGHMGVLRNIDPECNRERLERIFLGIYANPLDSFNLFAG